jgi:integrase
MSRKRRGRGEGSIFQRSDGLWVGTVSLGFGADKKRRRKTVYGATKKEVTDALLKLRVEYAVGEMADPQSMTMEGWLTQWLECTARVKTSPTTYSRYERVFRLQVIPHVGHIKLQKFDEMQVWNLLGKLEKEGESANSRRYTRHVLGMAMKAAKRFRYIVRSPVEEVAPPRVEHLEIVILSEDQVRQFLTWAAGRRYYALFVVAFGTGLRRGELFALHWEDIDFERCTLTVRKTLIRVDGEFRRKEPKSKHSRRTIKLPPFVMDALQTHRQKMLAEGNIAAPVFCTKTGKYLNCSTFFNNAFRPLVRKLDLGKRFRFHDIRHTHASLLLARGESIKAVSQRLGHSDVGFTLRTYAHLLPDADDKLAASIQGVLSGEPAQTSGSRFGYKVATVPDRKAEAVDA